MGHKRNRPKKKSEHSVSQPSDTTVIKQATDNPISIDNNKTVWQGIWSWPVIGSIVLFILAGGITFMTSAWVYAADLFYIAGLILFLCKFLTLDLPKKQRNIILVVCSLITVIAILVNHSLNHEHLKSLSSLQGRPDQPKLPTAEEIAKEYVKQLPPKLVSEPKKKIENKEPRPIFEITNPAIKSLPTDTGRYVMSITMSNIGDKGAYDLECKLIIIDQQFKTKPPVTLYFSSANEILPKNHIGYKNDTIYGIQEDMPLYLVFIMKYYSDKTHKKSPYSQIWYTKWDGIHKGNIPPNFTHCSINERNEIDLHLKSEIDNFLKQ